MASETTTATTATPANNEETHPRWLQMWREGIQPGQRFDIFTPAPILLELIREKKLPTAGRALVPGCGRGYDVAALASSEMTCLGIDIAPEAVQSAREWFQQLDPASRPPEANAQFEVLSFFDLPTDPANQFQLIYDYTFLCALDPSIRTNWARKTWELLAPGGTLVTVIFPIRTVNMDQGPPFAVSKQLYADLLLPLGFECLRLEDLPSELCHPGRDGTGQHGSTAIGLWVRK